VKYSLVVALAMALFVAAVLTRGSMPSMPSPHGIPVSILANGKPHPGVGLVAPLPNWIPLPENGYVTGAALYPPQPPFGPACVVMVRYDEPQGEFIVNYRHRLENAGFATRRIPILFHLIIDKPDAAYEADENNGGHVAYITLRSGFGKRFAQLTFYAPPAPRMHL
jgi:hypothetical protein